MMSPKRRLDRWPMGWILSSLLASLLLTGCLGGSDSLARSTWSLSSMAGSELLLGTAISLDFSRDTVMGSA
jgi:hypothetical protein